MTAPQDELCSLCKVKISTGSCEHGIDLGEGRIGMPRLVWEGLVADRLRLHDIEGEIEDSLPPSFVSGDTK